MGEIDEALEQLYQEGKVTKKWGNGEWVYSLTKKGGTEARKVAEENPEAYEDVKKRIVKNAGDFN